MRRLKSYFVIGLLSVLILLMGLPIVGCAGTQTTNKLSELQKSRSLRYIQVVVANWVDKTVITDKDGTRLRGPNNTVGPSRLALDFSNIVWSGTSFSGEYGSLDKGLWTIKGTVSPDGSEIASVNLTSKTETSSSKGDVSFQLTHLPLVVEAGNQAIAYVEGANLQKNFVSATSYSYEKSLRYPDGSETYEMNLASLKWDNPPNTEIKAGITFWISSN